MDSNKIGKFIQRIRKQKNMTQKELADKLFVTDKAVSKWERGLSFPDITILKSLSEILEVDVSEILNGDIGKKENINVKKAVEEAIKNINNKQEKREKRYNKIKKVLKIVSLIILILFTLLQLSYIFILQRRGLTYCIDSLFYIINEIILIFGMLYFILLKPNRKIKNIIVIIIFVLTTAINICLLLDKGFINNNYISFNENFSIGLIIKQNKDTGDTTLYRNKYLLFAQEKEMLSYPVEGEIKLQWLEKDICSITYKDSNNNLREYVATYGNRSDGLRYYYVSSAIYGSWQTTYKNGLRLNLVADSKGITITSNSNKNEFFEYSSTKQFGTIALVLYEKNIPRYIISLNKDATLDNKMDIIKEGGTISLTEISMNKTKQNILNCLSSKSKLQEGVYNITNMDPYSYKIKNDILYIRYNNEDLIEVPGNFTEDMIENGNYQISEYKTFFIENKDGLNYLVTSNDKGKTWERTKLSENNISIQNIQFLDENKGYMLEFIDAAMTTAYGNIKTTTDGGKSWTIVNNGIANIFRTSSKIYFLNDKDGFLTMPLNGISSKLYVTHDGGVNFKQVSVPKIKLDQTNLSFDDIYDYYNMPSIKDGFLTLYLSQGNDGDYNKGQPLKYISFDNGKTWIYKGN